MNDDQSAVPLQLHGASVLVLGATGVLGGRLADLFHAAGARLTLTGRSPEALAAVAQRLPGSAALLADVRDAETGSRLVEAAVAHGGGLTVLVNAAGVVAFGELADADQTVIEDLFLTNVLGPLWVAQAAYPALAASRGVLCQITGVVAEHPLAGMAAYGASKAALSSACAALSREWAGSGVTVVDARPGHTETGLAGRPLEGTAPRMRSGMDPAAVAGRIMSAIVHRQAEVPSTDFA